MSSLPVLGASLAASPTNVWEWLGDSSQRELSGSIPENLWLTLWHSLLAAGIATLIAVPIAVWLAHHRRAEVLSNALVNIGRIIPTVTVLAVFVVISLRNGFGFEPWPVVGALTLLAIPPIFANAYTGVRQVPQDAVAAGRAMGLSERQVMTGVELPLALPLIVAGLRVATTQLVATEALGALFGGRGLGLYLMHGFKAKDGIYQLQAGALLITATALGVDLVMWLVSKAVTPRGMRAPEKRTPISPTPTLEATP